MPSDVDDEGDVVEFRFRFNGTKPHTQHLRANQSRANETCKRACVSRSVEAISAEGSPGALLGSAHG